MKTFIVLIGTMFIILLIISLSSCATYPRAYAHYGEDGDVDTYGGYAPRDKHTASMNYEAKSDAYQNTMDAYNKAILNNNLPLADSLLILANELLWSSGGYIPGYGQVQPGRMIMARFENTGNNTITIESQPFAGVKLSPGTISRPYPVVISMLDIYYRKFDGLKNWYHLPCSFDIRPDQKIYTFF